MQTFMLLGLKISAGISGPHKGIWIETPSGSCATIYSDQTSLVAGFYKDLNKSPKACDVALCVDKDGLSLQVVDAKGVPQNQKLI